MITGCDAIGSRLAAVRPSDRQLRWQAREFYAFIHFGMNTATGKEWGSGAESPDVFNPTDFDADQWMSSLAASGMTGAILTAKHHDGFCLWPSRVTAHSVARSLWRGGKGDVVAEVAAAAARHGLGFGVYLSPWDRHERTYGTGGPYNDFFVAQLDELLTNYGPIFSVWFDGACGEGPDGKHQDYDWARYYDRIRTLQPDAVINVCGPDVRWCGNEAGHTRTNEWSVVPHVLQEVERIADRSQQSDDRDFSRLVRSGEDDLGGRAALAGYEGNLVWYPAEVNTSIRPGWFYHEHEDTKVRSAAELMSIYCSAVGGNASFLLNVPPTSRGVIADADAAVLAELGDTVRDFRSRIIEAPISFSSGQLARGDRLRCTAQRWGRDTVERQELGLANGTGWWEPDNDDDRPTIAITMNAPRSVEALVLKEEISLGQRLEHVVIRGRSQGRTRVLAEANSVGYQRIVSFPPTVVDELLVEISQARAAPAIAGIAAVEGG